MHSLHCARNIALCPDCDEPIPRGELEEHKEEVHGLKDCPMCAEKVEACKLEDHQASMCSKRTTLCKFCATHVEMGNLTEHENYCGSRTDKCEQCGEFIMLKNFDLHIDSNHGFIKVKDEPGPTPSWEKKPAVKSTSNYSSYTSQAKSTVSDPAPSTASQRSNFTATELFNNQDLYSSRRYSTTNGLSSSASSSALSSVNRSTSSSIVSSALNKSTSSSRVAETRRSSIRESTVSNGVSTSKSSIVGSVLDKRSTSIANAHVNGQLKAEGSTDVMLPCEFCEKMIPMYKLLSHQAECVNPSNVRGPSSTYSRYSSTSAVLGTSISRSGSLNGGPSSSRINKYLRQDSTSTPTEVETPPRFSSNGNNDSGTASRKISPTSNSSIVNRYIASPEPKTNGHESSSKKYLPESPPSYEKQDYSSHYTGRSSYLREESRRDSLTKSASNSKIKTTKTEAPGMYDNDEDREGLRQMLSSMRRDPMDVADDPDNNDGSFFPCEFCGDPYPCEFLMRHQMSCDLNPQPVSSGSGFDYTSIKKSIARNVGLPESEASTRAKRDAAPAAVANVEPEAIARESRRLSRSNSVIERSYSRSNIRASSVSRTSSFADRSYGTRTSLGRQSSFSIADYSSAVRRSSVFDGYAGYSIYSSISEGLDQITHGGRNSRRNSVTETTNYSLSRRGSFSARNDMPIAALQASLTATKASKEDERDSRESRREKPTATAVANAHINGQAKQAIQNGHHSHTNGYSRQQSQTDSTKAVDSPFGATNGHPAPNNIQRSESKVLRRRSSLKHSDSGYKLERKVSFHQHDQIIIDGKGVAVDENGIALPDQPDGEKKKKKRTEEEKQARKEKKEKKEAKRQARGMSKDRKCKVDEVKNKQHPIGGELFEQVSAKLHDIEREQNSPDSMPTTPLAPVPSSSLFPDFNSSAQQASNKSNTASVANLKTEPPHNTTANTVPGHVDVAGAGNTLTLNSEPVCRAKSSKGPAPQPPIVDNLVNLEEQSVVLREHNTNESEDRTCSKRNSLDNKSVQTLAKDLAAECAKAYELMESSLSKLTNDFSIGPFGLTPKTKVGQCL